jgi:biofilm PGA synthesis N-glycosyltransferase PgaC
MMFQSVDDVRYLIVSPVKDEARFLEETLRSVATQTIKPIGWVIVDDGSNDNSPQIIDKFAKDRPWITLVKTDRKTARQPGSSVIKAFNLGYAQAQDENYDFIIKLDCDLRFDTRYFEKILKKFNENPRLGIASGVYLEDNGQGWKPIKMPTYHAAGASKVIRKKCFDQIGGFIPHKGWDTVDEIKAQSLGWETGHFSEAIFFHLKNEGSGIGRLKTNIMLGEISYLTGSSKLFFLFKIVHRAILGRPIILNALFMFLGYMKALALRKELLVTREEAEHYRNLVLGRLKKRVKASVSIHKRQGQYN